MASIQIVGEPEKFMHPLIRHLGETRTGRSHEFSICTSRAPVAEDWTYHLGLRPPPALPSSTLRLQDRVENPPEFPTRRRKVRWIRELERGKESSRWKAG